MPKFTLFWLSGKREVIEGDGIASAMTKAGYGMGALRALDFFAEGDNKEYRYDKKTSNWTKAGVNMENR